MQMQSALPGGLTIRHASAHAHIRLTRSQRTQRKLAMPSMADDQELDVGITAYANSLPGFSAILKQRWVLWSDFSV